MFKDQEMNEAVSLISIDRTATFTVVLPERAVRALHMISRFGEDAFIRAVATTLSPNEAKAHRLGLGDVISIGGCCGQGLQRLEDVRDVMAGRKIAREPEKPKPPVPTVTAGMSENGVG